MQQRPGRVFLLAVGVLILFGTFAEATVVIPADLKKLTLDAEAIVYGRVVALQYQWASDRRGVDTIVSLQATSYLKGNFGAVAVFRVPGGRMGTLRSVTVGAPVFHVGDEVIVFLGTYGPTFPHIVGFNQGVFRVTGEQATGRQLVSSSLTPASTSRLPSIAPRGAEARQPVPLQQFEQQVQGLLEKARTGAFAKARSESAAAPQGRTARVAIRRAR